jgi:hypothetical protein
MPAGSNPSLLEEEQLFVASTDDLPSWFAISPEVAAEGCQCEKRVCGCCVGGQRFSLHRLQHLALRGVQDLRCRGWFWQASQGPEEQ